LAKKISELSIAPSSTADLLWLEVAREISAGVWNGISERIQVSTFLTLLANAGAAINVKIERQLNPTGAAYSASTTYTLYDYLDVPYLGGHYAYIGEAPSAGNAPPDPAYWVLISTDGVTPDTSSFLTQTAGDARYPLKTATDPYPTYLTQTEAAALFAPIGDAPSSGLQYSLNLTTTFPAATGQIRFNNATIASVTQINIHESDRNSAGMGTVLDAIAVGTRIKISSEDNEEIYAWFLVSTAPTDNGSDRTIPVTFVSFSGTFVAGEVAVSLLQIQGAASSGGGASGLKYTYQTTAGTGVISAANLATATTLTIGTPDAQGKVVTDVLGRLKAGAIIEIAKDANNRIRYAVTADHASGAVAVAVAAVYGAIAALDTVYLAIVSDAPSLAIVGGSGRVTCTASRTYYVRTAGTRTGSLTTELEGTSNTDADAFGTITACLAALKRLDFNGFAPTVFVNSGVFTEIITLPTLIGTDSANLIGNGVANTTFTYDLATGSGTFFGVLQSLSIFTVWKIIDAKITTTANNRAAILCGNGKVFFENIQTDSHYIDFWCLDSGIIEASGNYSYSRNKTRHIYCEGNGVVRIQGRTVAAIASPSFSDAGIFCAYGYPLVVINGNTYTGSATGKRYQADYGGRIISSVGATYLPGSVAGTTNGGFYDGL
jgi:hypothetical protein